VIFELIQKTEINNEINNDYNNTIYHCYLPPANIFSVQGGIVVSFTQQVTPPHGRRVPGRFYVQAPSNNSLPQVL